MANHKSAAKRARQTIKKTEHNSAIKGSIRTAEKKLRVAISEKNKDSINSLFKDYTSKMARAGRKGIFHAKTAARKVSRLAQTINNV